LDFTHQRYRYKHHIDEVEREKNRTKSSVRSKVEHVFAVMKLKFGFVKVRYRGLDKNANRLFCDVRSGEPVPRSQAAADGNRCVVLRIEAVWLSSGQREHGILSREKQTTDPSRLFTLSWHERSACSEVP
jgi:hypothetical protein